MQEPVSPEKVDEVVSGCKERGLIVGKNGDTVAGFNNIVTLAPPLSITEQGLRFVVQTLSEVTGNLA